MTLDEAIAHAEEVAEEHERHLKVYENMDEDRPLFREEENECKDCAEEHRQLAGWLKELKQLRKQTKKGHWIPCSERLPEMPFGCIVTVEEDDRNGEPQNVLYSEPVGYDGETWNRADGEPISFEVVAWMPLPEPYKEREE